MAWELFAEKNGVSFTPDTLFGSGTLGAQFSVMTGMGLPSEQGNYIRVTVDNRTPVVLPFYKEDNRASLYGEFDEQLRGSFVNYPLVAVSLPVAIQQEDCGILIGLPDNYFAPESYEGNHTIKIETGSDDGSDEPKRFKPIGVKEAMRHYVSTLENVIPATTIKGLTKQILDPYGANVNVQNARTIAQCWTALTAPDKYVIFEGVIETVSSEGQAIFEFEEPISYDAEVLSLTLDGQDDFFMEKHSNEGESSYTYGPDEGSPISLTGEDGYILTACSESPDTFNITISGFKPKEFNERIGVKEAMRNLYSVMSEETPANTIKGLTKQIMKIFVSNKADDAIDNSRTIAEIYEAAAIANGYEPVEPTE